MKYIRTKDGRLLETTKINIDDIEDVENLWCEFRLNNGRIHFVDYFPKEKETIEILQKEIKNVVFVKKEIDSDYEDYWYEPVDKKDILKQADTIEELCDLFVAFESNRIFEILSNFKDFVRQYASKNVNCYGAIWTEWGLKYVAKMNEKGELELL